VETQGSRVRSESRNHGDHPRCVLTRNRKKKTKNIFRKKKLQYFFSSKIQVSGRTPAPSGTRKPKKILKPKTDRATVTGFWFEFFLGSRVPEHRGWSGCGFLQIS
jgi:hypothetical protein